MKWKRNNENHKNCFYFSIQDVKKNSLNFTQKFYSQAPLKVNQVVWLWLLAGWEVLTWSWVKLFSFHCLFLRCGLLVSLFSHQIWNFIIFVQKLVKLVRNENVCLNYLLDHEPCANVPRWLLVVTSFIFGEDESRGFQDWRFMGNKLNFKPQSIFFHWVTIEVTWLVGLV